VRPLFKGDLPAVLAIEAEANPLPWSEGHFLPFVQAAGKADSNGGGEAAGADTGSNAGLSGADARNALSARPVGNGPVHMAWICGGSPEDGSGETAVMGFACAFAVADEVELQSLAVARSARGRGLGTALLEALLEWAGRGGYRRLHLEVRAGNAPALALYRRFGFAQTGTRRGYYQDNGEDALLLARDV
jgi:ribosomal protein S18 acetylase RimI-like enzyme